MRNKGKFITSPKGQKRKKNDPITIVILSSHPGHRMKSYGAIPLLNLGVHSLLDVQIEAIKAVHTNYEIVVCCGFEADRVARYIKHKYKNQNIRIVENQRYEETNTCESLRLCLNNINSDSLLVVNGGLLLYPELVKIQKEQPYLVSHYPHKKKSEFEIGSFCDNRGKIVNIGFGLPDTWSEIFYLNNTEAIEALRRIVSNEAFKNRLIFESLNELNNNRHDLEQVFIKEKVIKINNIRIYHKVKEYYENIGTQFFIRNYN